MKKKLIYVVLFINIMTASAESLWTFSMQKAKKTKDGVYEIISTTAEWKDETLLETDFVNEDGWLKIRNEIKADYKWNDEKRSIEGYDAPYVIKGGHFFVMLDSHIDQHNFKSSKYFTNIHYSNYVANIWEIQTNEENNLLKPLSLDYINNTSNSPCFNIKSITSSSFFIEKTKRGDILYAPCSLPFIIIGDDYSCSWTRYPPWVPGKEKNETGIGEYLEIEFKKPSNNIVVLNGYVDPYKHYLYKANNRVKLVEVRSIDEGNPFEITYSFDDIVYFAKIKLPRKADKVRFTIREVYLGEKWNDTCITAVITDYELN